MNFVTKLFVFFVAVFSIALVGMVIPFIASQENYKAAIDEAREAARVAEARTRLKETQLTNMGAELARMQDAQNQTIVDLRKQNEASTTRLTSLVNELQMEKVINAANAAELKGLVAAEQQHAAIVKAMAEELGALREREVRLRQEIVMQTDAAGALAGELEAVQRQARNLQERLTLSTAEAERLNELWERVPENIRLSLTDPNATAGQTVLTVPSVEVNGKVTKVVEADEQTFVQVDIGTQDQIDQNTKLVIIRKGQFVATVAVIRSDTKEAVGRVLLAKGPVQVGDAIVTGPGYGN